MWELMQRGIDATLICDSAAAAFDRWRLNQCDICCSRLQCMWLCNRPANFSGTGGDHFPFPSR
jgi:hypothetical protein